MSIERTHLIAHGDPLNLGPEDGDGEYFAITYENTQGEHESFLYGGALEQKYGIWLSAWIDITDSKTVTYGELFYADMFTPQDKLHFTRRAILDIHPVDLYPSVVHTIAQVGERCALTPVEDFILQIDEDKMFIRRAEEKDAIIAMRDKKYYLKQEHKNPPWLRNIVEEFKEIHNFIAGRTVDFISMGVRRATNEEAKLLQGSEEVQELLEYTPYVNYDGFVILKEQPKIIMNIWCLSEFRKPVDLTEKMLWMQDGKHLRFHPYEAQREGLDTGCTLKVCYVADAQKEDSA